MNDLSVMEKKFHTYFGHLTDQQGKRVHPKEIVDWFNRQAEYEADQQERKEAIAFEKFCHFNYYYNTLGDYYISNRKEDYVKNEKFTREQLYDLFKQKAQVSDTTEAD